MICDAGRTDRRSITDTPQNSDATAAAWAAILAESEAEAEAEAGLFVSGDEIKRELHESLARMDSGVGLTWRRGAYT